MPGNHRRGLVPDIRSLESHMAEGMRRRRRLPVPAARNLERFQTHRTRLMEDQDRGQTSRHR